ncbi:MAG TPA: Na+/H+ antiporter [Stellaceae bacterium]|nr:Na+/H+ antiporter [Stellaceae bacterium]
MNLESAFIILFVIAMVVAISVRRLRLPYTVGLVLAGLLLGSAHLFPAPELNKSLLFAIFLPGLIFEAAFHLDFQDLWRNRVTITSLAFPGVVASTALTALALAPVARALDFLPGFTWRHALVFGALISATDPVAVLALFRTLNVPRRLSLLLEGESLLNDGTGIVFFTLSLSIFAGAGVTAWGLGIEFLTVVGMGAAIGVAVGLVVSTILRHLDDPMIEVSLTTIAAYGSFVLADQLNYSGVIATVAAGILCGNYGARTGMAPSTRAAAETFWEFVAFALNSVVFLLIGIEVPISDLRASWLPILAAYLIVTLVRGVLVFVVWRIVGLTRERFSGRWGMALTWGGLRGALPMVLALGLPWDFPLREQIISITFGVVILSILGHGLTMAPLLKVLGIVRGGNERAAYDLLRGELQGAAAALEELDRLERLHSLAPRSLEQLRGDYQQRVDRVREEIGKLAVEQDDLHSEDIYQARLHLLLVEKNRVVDAHRRGLLSPSVNDRLLADIDARILQLESTGADGAPEPEQKPA